MKSGGTRKASPDSLLEKFSRALRGEGKSESTIRWYATRVRRFLEDVGVKDKYTTAEVFGFLAGYDSPASRNLAAFALKRYALLMEVPSLREILSGRKAERVPRLLKPALSSDQIGLIYKAVRNDVKKHAFFRILFSTGLRVSEIASLKVEDFDGRNLKIYQSKTREYRLVELDSQTAEAIRKLIQKRESGPLFLGKEWEMTKRGLQKMFCKTVEKVLGLKLYPHTARRSFATLLDEAGLSLVDIAQAGGWASIQTVQRYVSRSARESRRKALEVMEKI